MDLPGFSNCSKISFTGIKSGFAFFVQAGTSKCRSKHDSGYGTVPHTPSQDSNNRPPPKLHDQGVPEELERLFHDFKVIYTQRILNAVSDKCYGGDIAMKLRYLAKDDGLAEACIIIEGRTKALKRIRKILVQKDVLTFLRPHFRVCLIDAEPKRLALDELGSIHVMGDLEGRASFCGMGINAGVLTESRAATFGGLIIVEKTNRKFLFGLTAGHPVMSLRQAASGSTLNSEDDSDVDEEEDIDEEFRLYVPNICRPVSAGSLGVYFTAENQPSTAGNGETFTQDDNSSPKSTTNVGTIMADSFSGADENSSNHDWALIDLTCEKLFPNGINAHAEEGGIGPGFENKNLHCPRTASKTAGLGVVVLTPRGNVRGRLSAVKSSILMVPGKEFVDTYDFIPNTESQLKRGDSGSWVVDMASGEVFGHVVSVDAMGEAFVMPMQATFRNIRDSLGVNSVGLPNKEQVETYTKPYGPVFEPGAASQGSGSAESHRLQNGEGVDRLGNKLRCLPLNIEDQAGKLSRENSSRASGSPHWVSEGKPETRLDYSFRRTRTREDADLEGWPSSSSDMELGDGGDKSDEEFPRRKNHGKGVFRGLGRIFSKRRATTDATGRDQESESALLHDGTGRRAQEMQTPPTQRHTGVQKPSHHQSNSNTARHSPGPGRGCDSGYATMVNSPAYPAPDDAPTPRPAHGERADERMRAFGRHHTT